MNADRYVDYIDGNGLVSLMDGLNGYILDKIYNSSFGDLVPIIIANAIRIDIWILIEDGNNITTELIKCTNNTDQNKTRTVMLHKKGEHYNAIIPIDKPVGTRNNNIASCDDNAAISLVNRYHVLHHDCTDDIETKDQDTCNELFTIENIQPTATKIINEVAHDIPTNVECVLDTHYVHNEVSHDVKTLANSLSMNPGAGFMNRRRLCQLTAAILTSDLTTHMWVL